MHRIIAIVLAFGAAACGEPVPTEVQADAKAEPVPVFDVHEWGLLDHSLRTDGLELSAGPGGNPRSLGLGFTGIGLGKPVLYVHVDGKVDDFDLSATVTLPESMVVAEHFPAGELDEARRELRWNVRVRREGAACREERTYPAATDPACTEVPDHYCEAAELSEYESDDAACLEIDDIGWPLLFYRGGPNEELTTDVTLPLEVRREAREDLVQVTNRDTVQPIGKLWRVRRYGHGVQVVALDWPAPGETVTVPNPTANGPIDDAHAMIRTDLEAHGLTSSEIDAFEQAWHEVLFGPKPEPDEEGGEEATGEGTGRGGLGLRGAGRGGGGVGGSPIGLGRLGSIGFRGGPGYGYGVVPHGVVYDALIYWMPAADMNDAAELVFEPAARNVRRALLVRVDLVR